MDATVAEKGGSSPPVELSFRLNEDDFLALSNRARHTWLDLPGSSIFLVSRFLMASVPIILSLPWTLWSSESWNGLRGVIALGAIVAALAMFAFYPRYLRYKLRRGTRALNSPIHLDVHLMAGDQTIRMECGDDSSTVSWKTIERGEETPTHFFLFLTRLKAVVVPKRAFAGETDLGHFRQMVSGRIKDFVLVGRS